eukprot:scaffold2189_cov116-Cylindrotheca_fusiformis.AAC.13
MLSHMVRIVNNVARGYITPPKLVNRAAIIPFRCLPMDVDPYMHMNNSRYLVYAELARWRTFPVTGLVHRSYSKEGLFFILAECDVKYMREIRPFQKFVISTTLTIGEEDKWIYYHHHFLEHPDDVRDGEQKKFALVTAKAVLKQRNGKTIKPSTMMKQSNHGEWLTYIFSHSSKIKEIRTSAYRKNVGVTCDLWYEPLLDSMDCAKGMATYNALAGSQSKDTIHQGIRQKNGFSGNEWHSVAASSF